MKTSKTAKSAHEVLIADSIWDAFELMAEEMGSDREGLINQAMFTFARLNGFLMPAAIAPASAERPTAGPVAAAAGRDGALGHGEVHADDFGDDSAPEDSEEAAFQSEFDADMEFEPDDADADAAPEPEPDSEEVPAPQAEDSGEFLREDSPPPPPRRSFPPPPRRGAGSSLPPPPRPRRFQKAEAELEPAPEAEEEAFSPAVDEDDDRKAVAERVLETAAELERLIKGKKAEEDASAPFEPESTPVGKRPSLKPRAPVTLELYLVGEDGELEPIEKPRYIIGRGKHCDMVINSGKVSREHAVITKENGAYFIEDLGSSNGTWFKKQRIKKQQIEDGDEFYICADKVKFALR